MVVQRRVDPPAKAYSFGAEGNAALAGRPIPGYQQQQRRQPPQQPPRQNSAPQRRPAYRRRHLVLPRWVCVICLTVMLVTMFASYSEGNGTKSTLRRDIAQQESELIAAQARIAALDEELRINDDEVRMRAMAVNRLGMQVVTQAQVHKIPVPYVMENEPPVEKQQDSGINLIDLFLSIFQKK